MSSVGGNLFYNGYMAFDFVCFTLFFVIEIMGMPFVFVINLSHFSVLEIFLWLLKSEFEWFIINYIKLIHGLLFLGNENRGLRFASFT